MLRLDRICTILFILAFALLIPSVMAIKFADELIAGLLGILAVADCVVNNAWRRYTLLWIIMGIISFYALYSLTFVHYNTPRAIFIDWIIQLKPFVPFVVFLAVRPTLSGKDKKCLRIIAIANFLICAITLCLPGPILRMIMGHISYPGTVLLISAVVFAYASPSPIISKKDTLVIMTMLSVGILCGRSKYFGELIIAVFFLFFYARSVLDEVTLPRKFSLVCIPLFVLAVGWSKFKYYFLTGESTVYDPAVLESYARPVLYATGALIFINHIPLGSGLASFCSWASIDPYSNLYYEYGISTVYGLSPAQPYFICDAFYPSLAQFGIAGLFLFAVFWVYVVKLLKGVAQSGITDARLMFGCGWIITLMIMIESIASTTFVQTSGMCSMMLLGIICANSKKFNANENED